MFDGILMSECKQMVYLDEESDGARGLMGNIVPEGELADGAGLLPDGTPDMSFIASETHWRRLQIEEMTSTGQKKQGEKE